MNGRFKKSIRASMRVCTFRPLVFAWSVTQALRLFRSDSKSMFWHAKRLYKTMKQPWDPLSGSTPSILNLLIVIHPKDFANLLNCVVSVRNLSGHTVDRCIVVTTAEGVTDVAAILIGQPKVEIICEDEIILYEDRIGIKNKFPLIYGWVLQQFIILQLAAESSRPLLTLDSDTVIRNPRVLIAEDGCQILTPTVEFHRPYYSVLDAVNLNSNLFEYSFVPHWMIYQPAIVQSLILDSGAPDISGLLRLMLEAADAVSPSPLSADYELYAQYLYANKPESWRLARWANAVDEPFPLLKKKCKLHTLSLHQYWA